MRPSAGCWARRASPSLRTSSRWATTRTTPRASARIHWIRRRLGRRDTRSHLGTLLGSAVADRDFVAIPMTWGMVNELTTARGYHWIMDRTRNDAVGPGAAGDLEAGAPPLRVLPGAGPLPLERSARARRLVRWSLDHLWAPVGTGVRPQSETDFVVAYLFNNAGRASDWSSDMDATISELPGLAGSRYLRDGRDRKPRRDSASRSTSSRSSRRLRPRAGAPACPRACP